MNVIDLFVVKQGYYLMLYTIVVFYGSNEIACLGHFFNGNNLVSVIVYERLLFVIQNEKLFFVSPIFEFIVMFSNLFLGL